MRLPRRMQNIGRDDAGATMAEFAVVVPVLALVLFAIVEMSTALWQRQVAEFAMTQALRIATTRELIVDGVLEDCGVATNARAGTLCSEVAGSEGWSRTCTPAAPNICNATIMKRMLDEILTIAPNVAEENLVVRVDGVGLGFVGRGRPVPLITVTLTGLQYEFIALGTMVGLGDLTMGDIAASAPAEDLRGG